MTDLIRRLRQIHNLHPYHHWAREAADALEKHADNEREYIKTMEAAKAEIERLRKEGIGR